MNGRFVTFEGVEGSGKSTQARMLAEHFQRKGISVIVVREPGGTALGEAIRQLLLDPAGQVVSEAELLLFLAARAQNTAEVIQPALQMGRLVVCDRYTDSTIAYQGYGRGLDLPTVRAMNAFATGGLEPDLTVLLDLPVETGLVRQSERDRMGAESLEFHRRVREGYLAEAAAQPRRFRVLQAERPASEIHEAVVREVGRILSEEEGEG